MPNRHARLMLIVAPVAVAAVALAALGAPASAAPDDQNDPGSLSLVAGSAKQTIYRLKGEPVNLGQIAVYAVANGGALEFSSGRDKYSDPISTTVSTGTGGARRTVTLPPGTTRSINHLSRFLTLVVTNSKGKKVYGKYLSFCPESETTARYRPEAPAHSPYPQDCGYHPFAVGSVLGIQDGWSTPALGDADYDYAYLPFKAKNGKYTATVGVAPAYRSALGLTKADASVTIPITIAYGDEYEFFSARAGTGAVKPAALKPAATKPTSASYAAQAAADGLAPDLRALPAYGISLSTHRVKVAGKKAKVKRTYIDFGATVWNAGPSTLVVDGFRRPGTDLMDAYQYFFDGDGNQVGSAPAGTMEWDGRKGHNHWHFSDFARYSLLDSSKKTSLVSGKEAFCLANTDPIDTRVQNANWQPSGTDLSSACGQHSALGIREMLDVGWGDTYSQERPGQSLNITTLPKGIYYISVDANPDGKLAEVAGDNNTALRKVGIGGKPGGRRTLKVYPYEGIKTH